MPAYAPSLEADPIALASLAAHAAAGDAHVAILAAKADAAALAAHQAAQQAALAVKADLVNGVIPTSQVPAIAVGVTVTVANQASMLALSAVEVQPGDVAIRSDQSGRRWVLAAADPSLIGSWIALEVPDAVSSINGQQGAVMLGKANVGLPNVDNTPDTAKPVSAAQQAALDAKAATTDARFPAGPDIVNADIAAAAAIAEGKLALASDAAVGTASRRSLGTGAAQALPGDHASTTNARPPTVHKASHAAGAADALSPADIGSATSSALAALQATVLRMARASQFVPTRFGVSAYYCGSSLAAGFRNGGRTLDQHMLGAPYYALDDVTIGRVDVNVNAGVAGATFRPGIYLVDNADNPWQLTAAASWATLFAALDPIDCAVAGLKTFTPTVPVVIPAGNWFALGGAPQGALATLTIEAATWPSGPWGNANASGGMNGATGIALQHNVSVAGALPTAFVPVAFPVHVGAGLGFTRTA